MQASFLRRHPIVKDIFSVVIFVILVGIGTLLINTFIFRSFNVEGPSMEKTLYTGDRLIVNRLPVSLAHLKGDSYIPKRGEIIVFKNPSFQNGLGDEFIVKRVIALTGERVVLKDGTYTVYNEAHPDGFNPDDDNNGEPGSPTSGSVNQVVAKGTVFVSGDHRQDNFSYDSRNGLGTIPYYDIIGPVELRLFPFNKIRMF